MKLKLITSLYTSMNSQRYRGGWLRVQTTNEALQNENVLRRFWT